MGGMSGAGTIGELPAGPGTGIDEPRPPSLRDLLVALSIVEKCKVCQERDKAGNLLPRGHTGGALTCGAYRGGQCGKDEGNGMGCILQLAAVYEHKHCDRGHW